MNHQKLTAGIEYLAGQGLNLYAIYDCGNLPEDVSQLMADIPLRAYTRLALLGNGGGRFWSALQAFGMRSDHPVDHFSLAVAQTFIADFLEGPPVLILYPGQAAIPLQRLGALAGWSHPSPLGLGISPTYGVWFAYRVAFLTTLPLPLTDPHQAPSPCDSCAGQPCLAACPAGAVRGLDAFDIPACATYRLKPESACQDRCLARLACPYFPEHRYPLAQIQYHYRVSLETIRLYYGPESSLI